MGNNNQKLPLRKAQSVPESQFLQATNPDFVRGKTRSSARLARGKSQDELDRSSEVDRAGPSVPLVEALFLPDFPVRDSLEEQEFEALVDELHHIVERLQNFATLEEEQQRQFQGLHFARIYTFLQEIDDRTMLARRLRERNQFTVHRYIEEVGIPLVYSLVNEIEDAFHCCPVLSGFAAFDLTKFPNSAAELEEYGKVIDVIAKGAYGNVLRVRREDEKQYYAMKVMGKTQIIVEGAIQQCKDEAAIQAMLGDHPFIVKLHEYWQSKKYLYIVLDYIPYGDMFTLWTFHGYFPEQLVKIYVAEMAMVLDFLHKSEVIYRDIKMENILLDASGHIQLTDFGLSKWLGVRERTRTVCGTLQYMAPEVLTATPYGHSADWWSLGIIMFVMLAGKYPAEGASNHEEMAKKVFDCDYLLPNHVSDNAQDVIDRLLMKRPERRLTDMFSLQNVPFYRMFDFTAVIEKKISPKSVVPEDFFPMTGSSFSYSPNSNPPSSEEEFAEFDFVWNLPPDTQPSFV